MRNPYKIGTIHPKSTQYLQNRRNPYQIMQIKYRACKKNEKDQYHIRRHRIFFYPIADLCDHQFNAKQETTWFSFQEERPNTLIVYAYSNLKLYSIYLKIFFILAECSSGSLQIFKLKTLYSLNLTNQESPVAD